MINHLITAQAVPPKNILFLNVEHPYFLQYAKDVAYLQKIYDEYLKFANPSGKNSFYRSPTPNGAPFDRLRGSDYQVKQLSKTECFFQTLNRT